MCAAFSFLSLGSENREKKNHIAVIICFTNTNRPIGSKRVDACFALSFFENVCNRVGGSRQIKVLIDLIGSEMNY